MHHEPQIDIQDENRFMADLGPRLVAGGAVVGAVGIGLALLLCLAREENGVRHFLHAYLLNFAYFLSIALGALFFVATQQLTAAGWSVTVRRIAELMAGMLPWMLALFIPLLLLVLMGNSQLYHWNDTTLLDPDSEHYDPLIAMKRAYLNPAFFGVRAVIYFLIWGLLARFFLSRSTEQDETRDPELTLKMQRVSAPALVLFALTLTFAAFDWLMSLDAHWFSTIFGVYYFAGSALSFFAAIIIISQLLQASGRLSRAITVEHYHDLGKFLFGFVVFWAYIAFSQYMLIWYANIPEETQWFQVRQTNGWGSVSVVLIFANFFIPFFFLVSRHIKRNRLTLAIGAVYILAVHWLDLYWIVMPSLMKVHTLSGLLIDLACFVGFAGLCVAGFGWVAGSRSLVPVGDPRLHEALAFKNM